MQLFVIIHSTLRSELLGGEKQCFYTADDSLDEKLSIVGYRLIEMEISHGNPCDLISDCIIRVPCNWFSSSSIKITTMRHINKYIIINQLYNIFLWSVLIIQYDETDI